LLRFGRVCEDRPRGTTHQSPSSSLCNCHTHPASQMREVTFCVTSFTQRVAVRLPSGLSWPPFRAERRHGTAAVSRVRLYDCVIIRSRVQQSSMRRLSPFS
jgi:hypothetical protein